MYKVKSEGAEGRVRVLHRNLLLPCHFLEQQSANTGNKRNSRNRKKRSVKTSHVTDEAMNEARESDTDEDGYSDINFEEYRSAQRPEPVVVPDVEINGDIPNEGPDLVNVNDQGGEELNGEVLPHNEIGNVNAPVQNEMAENEDQPWNDENIEDPWPAQRPQRVRQPPVRFGYNQPGNPALFCQAVNTNLQPWQMTPYPPWNPGWLPPQPQFWSPIAMQCPWQMFHPPMCNASTPFYPIGPVGMW